MKSTNTTLAIIALSLGGLAWLPAGCAGSATRESTGEYVDDATITTKVKAQFVRDSSISALDIKVETFKGVVALSGFVDTADQKARAAQEAAGVPGVVNVKNNITVK